MRDDHVQGQTAVAQRLQFGDLRSEVHLGASDTGAHPAAHGLCFVRGLQGAGATAVRNICLAVWKEQAPRRHGLIFFAGDVLRCG